MTRYIYIRILHQLTFIRQEFQFDTTQNSEFSFVTGMNITVHAVRRRAAGTGNDAHAAAPFNS